MSSTYLLPDILGCVARTRTVSTSSRQHWQSLRVKQLGRPSGSWANQKTHLSQRCIWEAVLNEAHFFPFNLNIGVDISAIVWDWYEHNSTQCPKFLWNQGCSSWLRKRIQKMENDLGTISSFLTMFLVDKQCNRPLSSFSEHISMVDECCLHRLVSCQDHHFVGTQIDGEHWSILLGQLRARACGHEETEGKKDKKVTAAKRSRNNKLSNKKASLTALSHLQEWSVGFS